MLYYEPPTMTISDEIDKMKYRQEGEEFDDKIRRIAGALQPGDRVAIVEDTVTRGLSIFEAVDAVREFGAIPAFISVIVDRGGTCAEMARSAGVPYVPMLTAPDLGFEFGS